MLEEWRERERLLISAAASKTIGGELRSRSRSCGTASSFREFTVPFIYGANSESTFFQKRLALPFYVSVTLPPPPLSPFLLSLSFSLSLSLLLRSLQPSAEISSSEKRTRLRPLFASFLSNDASSNSHNRMEIRDIRGTFPSR